MARRDDWIRGTLSGAPLELADTVARQMQQNVRDLQLGQGRYAHTSDEYDKPSHAIGR